MEAGNAVCSGILRVYPDAKINVLPLADGGEGTVEALTLGMEGELQSIIVTGPINEQKVTAKYGILRDKKTAIIEMAAAAGLTLLPPEKRNPLYTTTYGVGEILRDAIHKGCRHFIVGIGGSATNDGGLGMLQALGWQMLDSNGEAVPHNAIGLEKLAVIDDSIVLPELKECTFRIACDVTNPLLGQEGCSAVFGPQKGAPPNMIPITNSICWMAPYFMACGVRRSDIRSACISLRLKASLTTHSTLSTQRAPRNGGSLVMLWKVGMNHRPPMPTKSIRIRCQGRRFVSSPR